MVASSGGIARFGGNCRLCWFDRERERGRERSELFILFDGVVYIILMSYMFLSKKEKNELYVKIKTEILDEL